MLIWLLVSLRMLSAGGEKAGIIGTGVTVKPPVPCDFTPAVE
jgi:hypothetical protein